MWVRSSWEGVTDSGETMTLAAVVARMARSWAKRSAAKMCLAAGAGPRRMWSSGGRRKWPPVKRRDFGAGRRWRVGMRAPVDGGLGG